MIIVAVISMTHLFKKDLVMLNTFFGWLFTVYQWLVSVVSGVLLSLVPEGAYKPRKSNSLKSGISTRSEIEQAMVTLKDRLGAFSIEDVPGIQKTSECVEGAYMFLLDVDIFCNSIIKGYGDQGDVFWLIPHSLFGPREENVSFLFRAQGETRVNGSFWNYENRHFYQEHRYMVVVSHSDKPDGKITVHNPPWMAYRFVKVAERHREGITDVDNFVAFSVMYRKTRAQEQEMAQMSQAEKVRFIGRYDSAKTGRGRINPVTYRVDGDLGPIPPNVH